MMGFQNPKTIKSTTTTTTTTTTTNSSSISTSINGGFEANTMAILDPSGVKDSRDVDDDKLTFLEAVRAASLVSDSPTAPSWAMLDAIFEILRGSDSLELAMTSYQLLIDLDKHYPRIYLESADKSEDYSRSPDKPGSSSTGGRDLVVVKEAWIPFSFGSETAHCNEEGANKSSIHLDSMRFFTLIEEICQDVNQRNSQLPIKTAEKMLLFQYLVSVLETDFLARHTLYKETSYWFLLRESLLSILLGSRRLNFKSVVRDCMSIISRRCHQHTDTNFRDLKDTTNVTGSTKIAQDCDVALAFAATQLERQTCIAFQNFLTLIMELDVMKKEADVQGLTSRADGSRTPVLDIILDELTYNKDYISPFLEVYAEDKWKLEIVLQYFSKYCSKPNVRTRRSDSPTDVTIENILNYLSTAANVKAIARKVFPEDALLLLAHAFQAYLSLHINKKYIGDIAEKGGNDTPSQISSGLISAYKNIRKANKDLEIAPFVKEALFTAATIASQNLQP